MKILYEDENLIVIDKPASMVVHPGAGLPAEALAKAGEQGETLVDWFKKDRPDTMKFTWPEPERPGIVHRLDKDTSGLIILAKNPASLKKMQELFQAKNITKIYLALVFGKLDKTEGEITGLIGRDPNARRQQIAKSIHFDFQAGKVREAKTFYKVIKEYRYDTADLTLVEATLDTGRMHQIRVHFKSIGHPVLGDQTYNIKHSRILSKKLGLSRQFLHAYKLSFINPFDNRKVDLESPLSRDLQNILAKMR